MIYRGRVQNGVVSLDDPGALPDGTVVDVSVASTSAGAGELRSVEGAANIDERVAAIWADVPTSARAELPPDLTDHLDHYGNP
jgi:hypothetical protein